MTVQPCPPPEQLEALLTERLDEGELAPVARHLQQCSRCRNLLDQLRGAGRGRRPGEQGAPRQPPADLPGGPWEATTVVPSQAPAPAADLTARLPAGYEVLGEVGRGGVGVVYKARHLRLKRTVALKMLLAGPRATREDLARFRAEAEAVARLQHPNIVQVYEVGEHDGLPYVALEFVDGGSLSDRLDGAPQPPPDAAALVEALARAVRHAHEHGVVHRDIKPANVLLASGVASRGACVG